VLPTILFVCASLPHSTAMMYYATIRRLMCTAGSGSCCTVRPTEMPGPGRVCSQLQVLNESSVFCCAALRCAVRCAVLSACAHPQCNVLCRRNHRPLGDEWYAHYWSWRRASAWLEWQHGEKHAFWEQFYAKLIILPRQARDKLRENAFCAGDSRAGCQDYLVWRWLRVAGGVLEQIRQIQSPCG
jgi:hypothetical protein